MHLKLVCGLVTLVFVVGFVPIERMEDVQAQVTPDPCADPTPCIPIGTVQGAVSDSADGRAFRSTFAPPTGNGAGQTVRIRGVIYQKTQACCTAITPANPNGTNHGFFVQNTAGTADVNPLTSDGVFVFIGGFTTVLPLVSGQPPYTPQVGDEIVLQGRVSEFFFLTEITSPRWVGTLRTGVNINAEISPFDVKPPDVLADAYRYWERREGMRGQVPANSLVVGRREVFPSTIDGEVWVIRPDHPIAARRDPYTRRVFRDPHPLDDIGGDGVDEGVDASLFDNGNGFRILLGSLGLKATMNTRNALIAPARTFDRVTGVVEGGTYFAFNKYSIMPRVQISLTAGPDTSLNAPVPPYNPAESFRIATYNVENLYDRRDDPFDGCDFNGTGNPGCALDTPAPVRPPFDYVPTSEAEYRERLGELADQIVKDLGAPDLILVQEAEDQDICFVSGSALSCGSVNNQDGQPDTLQDLALTIAGKGGPNYKAAADRDGADDRGIISAFLFRTDRVELLPAAANDPVLGNSPQVEYRAPGLSYNSEVQNPKVLNAPLPADVDRSTTTDGDLVYTRPPQVGLFRVWRDGIGTQVFVDLYALSNHFSSVPDRRVGQRKEQALYAAAIFQALKKATAVDRVIIGGDLNVYPRPDDAFAPGDPLFPSDQLAALYDAGLKNLWTRLLATQPSAAYSYVFEGQTQTLDQLFVTARLRSDLVGVWAAHVNSDWPQDHSGDGPRGSSDHDPQGADFEF